MGCDFYVFEHWSAVVKKDVGNCELVPIFTSRIADGITESEYFMDGNVDDNAYMETFNRVERIDTPPYYITQTIANMDIRFPIDHYLCQYFAEPRR